MAGTTGNAQDGIDAAGVAIPAGGEGIRGWLSGIYSKLSGTLTVALSSSSPLDVSDRSARLLGHVTVDNPSSVGTVSVSNFPATQPVSGAVSVTGTVPVTGTFFQATQPVSGSVSVANFPATQPVSVATMPTTPVTGTFWQATQPVSLATNTPDVTDRAARLLGHVTVDNFPATQPVSGTVAVSGTVPVSLATNTPDVTDRAARLLGHVTVDSAPTTAVTQAALTKGTQGTNGVSTQDLKDAGRTAVVLSVTAVTSAITEAMFTLNIWKPSGVTTGTSYTVTSGKTFRIQAIQFGARFATPSTTVTFANSRFNLRSGNAVTSPLIYGDSKMAAANAPTPNSDLAVPDGLEIAGGTVIGLSHVDSAATLLLDALIVGYEY